MKKEKNNVSTELSRDLSLFHITMMGLGMMIGAGIFLGVGKSIYYTGPGGVLLTFALNGFLAILTAMSYAELSSAIPKAGGAYNFARIGFGKGTSFVAGWMEWFASSVAGSMYAITFSIYIIRYLIEILTFFNLSFLDNLNQHIIFSINLNVFTVSITYKDIFIKILAIIITLFFIYINYKGSSETGKVGAFFTFGQILFLVIIGIAGFAILIKSPDRFKNFSDFLPKGWGNLLVMMGFTYVAFEGYEVIAQTGDETINPRKNLPKAIILSVMIVTIIYVIVAFATIVSVKAGQNGVTYPVWKWIGNYKEEGFGEAVSRLMPFGNLLVTLAVIFASTSALNATIYSATRASYALGRDRMLPKIFSKISLKRKTPVIALLFTSVIVIIVALLPTEHVTASASIMFLFLFLLVNICVIKIRKDMGDELKYGYLMPLFPLFPILAIISLPIIAVALFKKSIIAWILAPLWIIIGLIIYFLYSKKRAIPSEDEIHIIEEEKATIGDGLYHVMVSVSNPQNALSLVSNTYKICKAKKAKIELLHMIPVPKQVPLEDAENYMQDGKEGIVEAMLYLAPLFPLSTTIRYCRNIARGIVNAIKEKNIELLILGWHGKMKKHWYSMGSTIDPIIEKSLCNVLIIKDCENKEFKNILVPISGGPNSSFALEVASIIVDKNEGKINLINVNDRKSQFDIEKFIEKNIERLHINKENIDYYTIYSDDITGSIIEESKNYDLVIIGSTYRNFIFQMTGTTIPEKIAKRCEKPLIMVKAANRRFRSIFNFML